MRGLSLHVHPTTFNTNTVVAPLPMSICPQSHLIDALVLSCRANQLDGLANMGLASRRAISFKDPKSGKSYKLNDKASSGMSFKASHRMLPERMLSLSRPTHAAPCLQTAAA